MGTLNLWNIPVGVPFLKTLVDGLPQFCRDQNIHLGELTLYVPYARAGVVVRQMLVERAEAACFLPRIEVLGEWTEEGPEFPLQKGVERTIPPLVRQALLAKLVREKQMQLALQEGVEVPPFQMTLQLVDGLIAFLDQACIEEVSLENLDQLVPEMFASHWQITLDFMRILQTYWPQLLQEKGYEEPYVQHHRWVQRKLTLWKETPPEGWVLAAGSTGTMPATAAFLKAIAALPRGGVVLPGLDSALEQAPESACHPQYALQQLLKRMDRTAASVPLWSWMPELSSRALRRQNLVSSLFQDSFEEQSADLRLLEGIYALPCATVQEEAETIALMLREILETPRETAALVSADRLLVHQVFTALKRWGIVPYNSASVQFRQTDLGTLVHLALQVVVERGAPVALLSLLKHPLCRIGDAKQHHAFCVELERHLLRGVDPDGGIAHLQTRLAGVEASVRPLLHQGLEQLRFWLEPFWVLLDQEGELPFLTWVRALREMVQRLGYTNPPLPLGERWTEGQVKGQDPYFKSLTSFLESLEEAAASFPSVSLEDAVEGIGTLLEKLALPPEAPTHPRIRLLGTLEARLLQADRVILGGLNEGTWPPLPQQGPWLNRPMRQDLGLPPLERRVGLSAHDFSQTFSSPTLILMRALRSGGAPTVPSRFLARLETLLKARGVGWQAPPPWLAWAQALDAPAVFRTAQIPLPCPPVCARPRQLSVTQIELWRKDPYALYARHILKLKPLEPLDASPDYALQGTLLHQVFDRFLRECDDLFAPQAFEELCALGQTHLKPFFHKPAVQTFWWQRFQNMATWFLETERQRRLESGSYQVLTEVEGKLMLEAPAGPFCLKARADRIDVYSNGTLDIIDYKTGSPPSETDVVSGKSPQLPLEAAIALKGGFAALKIQEFQVATLQFWHVSGRGEGGEIKTLKTAPQALAMQALEGLQCLVSAFDESGMPYYPQGDLALGNPDYTHLVRFLAWNGR